MIGICDINSFYASTESVFRPDLKGKPVVILSNNDGCCIARNKEAKHLNISMGEPFFKIKNRFKPDEIHIFSSNYALYADMSHRVMQTLEEMAPLIEIYSIDEAWLWLAGMQNIVNYEEYGHKVKQRIYDVTGMHCGIGVAKTKTLSKLCNHAAKTWTGTGGVVALTEQHRLNKLMSLISVEEVWGVGRRISKKLNAMGIDTALDLCRANTSFIRKNFSVVLERTVRELNGEPCISLENQPPAKQQIVCSRSFGERITQLDQMRQAVCRYAERAAEKLRQEKQFCRQVAVFFRTSPFAPNDPYYSNTASEKLMVATQDTRDIIQASMHCLEKIWVEGYRYATAGIMLNDFSPTRQAQLQLFEEAQPKVNSSALMDVLDRINQKGVGHVWFAGQGIAPSWQMKREMLSPAYTTRWKDLPLASLK